MELWGANMKLINKNNIVVFFSIIFVIVGTFFLFPKIILNVNADDLEVLLGTNFGGDNIETFQKAISTTDGGYIVVGYSYGASNNLGIHNWGNEGNADGIVIKFNSDGTIAWAKNCGSTQNDFFYSVTETNDGGYLVVGNSHGLSTNLGGVGKDWNHVNTGATADAIAVRLDQNGDIVWSKNYGGNYSDYFSSVITINGEYIISGYSYSESSNLGGIGKDWNHIGATNTQDGIIAKIDDNGDVIWSKNYGGNASETFNSLIQTDEGYIVVGHSNGGSNNLGGIGKEWEAIGLNDAIVIKVDNNGDVIWGKNYGGNLNDYFTDIVVTTDGGLLATGYSFGTSSNIVGNNWGHEGNESTTDGIVVRLDREGKVLWSKNYGSDFNDFFRSVVKTQDGYIIGGNSLGVSTNWTNEGNSDGIVLVLDENGQVVWGNNFGSQVNDCFFSIINLSNEEYAVFGYSRASSSNLGINKEWGNSGGEDVSEDGIVMLLKTVIVTKHPDPVIDIRQAPATGNKSNIVEWSVALAGSIFLIVIICKKKDD